MNANVKNSANGKSGAPKTDSTSGDAPLALKERLDVSKIFLSFCATGGDVLATAQLAECSIDDVVRLSVGENWLGKLETIGMPKGITVEDGQKRARERNRIANYVQSIRLRALIDRTVQQLFEDEENLKLFCTERDRRGERFFSMKPLQGLIESAETVHRMIYRSLGDVLDKKAEGGPLGDLSSLRQLHLQVINHLHASGGSAPENPLRAAEAVTEAPLAKDAVGMLDVRDIMASPSPEPHGDTPPDPTEPE